MANTANRVDTSAKAAAAADAIRTEVHKVIVGQADIIEDLLIGLFCQGHVLLIGVPGLAKTLLVKTLAGVLDLNFNRIQFTPDLMPTDITGTDILEDQPGVGRAFRFLKGPLFANIILADEINRTPPKTQAALLQAMQELQVTAGGSTYKLDPPFFVLATQNPIEQEGTYPLPEAQLDRFMLNVMIGYPTEDEEVAIVERTTTGEQQQVSPVVSHTQVMDIQKLVRAVPVSDHVMRYAVKLVKRTRPDETDAPDFVKSLVSWGAGPRASQHLVLAARANALLRGATAASTDDVKKLAPSVLRHRVILNFAAEAEGIKPDSVIERIIREYPPDGGRIKR